MGVASQRIHIEQPDQKERKTGGSRIEFDITGTRSSCFQAKKERPPRTNPMAITNFIRGLSYHLIRLQINVLDRQQR